MIDLLRQRRSVRRFEDRPVEADTMDLLKEALLRSPSSRKFDPWEFVFVDDKPMLDRLSRCKPHGAAFLKNAPLGIVVCGDEAQSDVWIEDCAIASILVQMTAQSLGLGSCWVQVRRRQHTDTVSSEVYIRDLLQVPPTMRVLSVIAVGYPAEQPEPIPVEQLKRGKLHDNRW